MGKKSWTKWKQKYSSWATRTDLIGMKTQSHCKKEKKLKVWAIGLRSTEERWKNWKYGPLKNQIIENCWQSCFLITKFKLNQKAELKARPKIKRWCTGMFPTPQNTYGKFWDLSLVLSIGMFEIDWEIQVYILRQNLTTKWQSCVCLVEVLSTTSKIQTMKRIHLLK